MSRKNPQVEALERENKILREEIERRREAPADITFTGCGDHSCVVVAPQGQGTNGGCRCEAFKLRRALAWWKRRAEFLVQSTQELRDDVAVYDRELTTRRGIIAEIRGTSEAVDAIIDRVLGPHGA